MMSDREMTDMMSKKQMMMKKQGMKAMKEGKKMY